MKTDELIRNVERLNKRVAALEVRDTAMVIERLDSFSNALRHMWKEIERVLGQRMERPPRPPAETPPVSGVGEIARDIKREAARRDGERAVR